MKMMTDPEKTQKKGNYDFSLSEYEREQLEKHWWNTRDAPFSYIKGERLDMDEYQFLMEYFIEKYTLGLKMGI